MPLGHAPVALIVIDVQQGFNDPWWGPTTNQPGCEHNITRLLRHWRATNLGPVILVRHDSVNPASPLHPSKPGNQLMAFLEPRNEELLISKTVNSAFYGRPDLHDWLTKHSIVRLVVCGIQTNMCVETTTRMGGNLGYDVTLVLDATRTFDLTSDVPGSGVVTLSADDLMQATAVNLHAGGFAQVTDTDSLLEALVGS